MKTYKWAVGVMVLVAAVAYAQPPQSMITAYNAAELAYSQANDAQWWADEQMDLSEFWYEVALAERNLCVDPILLQQGNADVQAGNAFDGAGYFDAAAGWNGLTDGNTHWQAAVAAEGIADYATAETEYWIAEANYTVARGLFDEAKRHWQDAVFEYESAAALFIQGQP